MQKHDPASSVARRAIVLSPDRELVAELEPILNQQLAGYSLTHIDAYPPPAEAPGVVGAGASQLLFLDVASDPDQSVAVLQELSRVPGLQVLALLGGNDPDAILKCLRAGAIGAIEMATIISRDPAPPPASYVKSSGGIFRDMMIHDLDLARFLVGEEFVTAGGVSLGEVNLASMESRRVSGLYLVGELLDVDGVTGGFNFQHCWTSGWLAGQAIAAAAAAVI